MQVGRTLGIACVWIATLILVHGCANRPEEGESIRTLIPMEAVDPLAALEDDIGSEAAQSDANDGVHTVLALSQGGAMGAFGAGVLAGWSENGNRPSFDVITGVSTGALLAVMAFLGPEYDPLIKELYTTLDSKDIFRHKGLSGILGDSLYSNEPLKRQIERVITPAFLEKVAAEHNKGRRLYVATTNIDAGELTIWDMGRIAQGGRTNTLLHFQKVVRASAAVPGYFEPVYIKPQRGIQLRQAHVDGGVKEPVLVTDFMFQSPARKKILYVVVNGSTKQSNDSVPIKANLANISRKAITELIRELQEDTIYRDYVLARNSGAQFRMTAIPDAVRLPEDVLEFKPEFMSKLYDIGYEIGKKGPGDWRTTPPRLGRLEQKITN